MENVPSDVELAREETAATEMNTTAEAEADEQNQPVSEEEALTTLTLVEPVAELASSSSTRERERSPTTSSSAAVVEKLKSAAAAVSFTVNERLVPAANHAASSASDGFNEQVVPAMRGAGARISSFFGKVKHSAEKLRSDPAVQKLSENFKSGATSTLVAMKTSGAELSKQMRTSAAAVADAVATTAAAPGMMSAYTTHAPPPTADGDIDGAQDQHHHTSSLTAAPSAPAAPTALLGTSPEQLAAWDTHSKPVPYLILACVHWLSVAGLHTEFVFELDPGAYESRSNVFQRFFHTPLMLLPTGIEPIEVASMLKTYLQSLPEPLLSFSLYAALVNCGRGEIG